jgi:hypothetical protein
MASFKKDGTVWRVQIALKGLRQAKSFSTKAEAAAWAAARESEIRTGVNAGPGAGKTLDDAFNRYLREVSVHKRGHRMERCQGEPNFPQLGIIGFPLTSGIGLRPSLIM